MKRRGSGAELQAKHYRATACSYEHEHVRPGDEHFVALRYVAAVASALGAASVLDVGAGTGRASSYLINHLASDVAVIGLEPSAALLGEARARAPAPLVQGMGEVLPFADASFDVVCETGVLHHVPRPELVVAEMLRVARTAVFVSDSNRFGQGSVLSRLLKFGLVRLKLWRAIMALRTRGRGYLYSAGDGVFYSYSVWDSYDQLADWSERLIFVDTSGLGGRTRLPLLLAAPHVLVCCIRESAARRIVQAPREAR